MTEELEQTLARWFADPDTWVGVFENKDLSSSRPGHRVGFAFPRAQFEQAKLGETRAPDHKEIGLGWRYLLVAKAENADDALRALRAQ